MVSTLDPYNAAYLKLVEYWLLKVHRETNELKAHMADSVMYYKALLEANKQWLIREKRNTMAQLQHSVLCVADVRIID